LTRFGFSYLEELFKAYGVKVIDAFQEEPKDYMQELVEDLNRDCYKLCWKDIR